MVREKVAKTSRFIQKAGLLYFFFYIFPFPLQFFRPLGQLTQAIWLPIERAFGSLLFGSSAVIEADQMSNGADTQGHLARMAVAGLVAIAAVGVGTRLDLRAFLL